jgi:hypothetical protein
MGIGMRERLAALGVGLAVIMILIAFWIAELVTGRDLLGEVDNWDPYA